MKKLLIGLAAGALAFTATTAPVNAGAADGKSVYDILTTNTPGSALAPTLGDVEIALADVATLLIDASGLDEALDNCGNTGNNNGLPNYTVFFPGSSAIFTSVLAALDLSLGQVLAQPALVKTVLLYHVVPSNIAPVQLQDPQNTRFMTMGGLELIKTDLNGPTVAEGYAINGYSVPSTAGGIQACNGWVYLIAGFLAPNSAIGTIGLTSDGSTTQAAGGSGEGLPATGSESLALTYAALASLIAGAGVLVIRRRSVA